MLKIYFKSLKISKYEQALKDKNKLNDQNNKMNYNNLINPNETKNDEFKFHSENKLSNSEKEKKNFYNMNQYQENLSQNNILNENKHSKPHFLDVSDLKEDRQNEEENQFEFILTDKILIKFLKNLTKHRESLSNEFKQLLESISKEKNNLSIESFGNFLSNSRFNLTKKEIATIIKIFDYDNVKIFPSIDFLESYKAVLLLEENIQSKMKEICQVFELALSRNQLTLTAFEKELSKRSDFGYIQKSAFEGYIRNDLRISEETFKNLDTFFMFSELILISGFIEKILLVQSGSNSNSLLNLMDASVLGMQIIEKILLDLRKNPEKTKDFLEFLLEINKNLESQEENKNQFLKIREIITLFQANGLNLTFIEVFFILKTINFSQRKKNIDKTMGFEHQIETKLFSEFFIEKLKGLMDQPRLLSPILQKIKIEENDFDEINDLNTLLNEKKAITIENNENESKAQIENEDKEVNINYLMKNTEETNRRTGDRENEEINEKLQKPIFDIKNLQENDDKFEKPITAYQHQLKLKCYWLENCELEKSYEGGNLTLR